MAWSFFRVSNVCEALECRRIHVMHPVHQNRTGQPWARSGHPRLPLSHSKAWMPATSAGMTVESYVRKFRHHLFSPSIVLSHAGALPRGASRRAVVPIVSSNPSHPKTHPKKREAERRKFRGRRTPRRWPVLRLNLSRLVISTSGVGPEARSPPHTRCEALANGAPARIRPRTRMLWKFR
jgi:hypothetical protein